MSVYRVFVDKITLGGEDITQYNTRLSVNSINSSHLIALAQTACLAAVVLRNCLCFVFSCSMILGQSLES